MKKSVLLPGDKRSANTKCPGYINNTEMNILSSLCVLVSSADNLCKQFGPRSGPTNVGPDLDPNCLTL